MFLDVLTRIVRQADGGALMSAEVAQLQTALRYFAEAAPTHTSDEEDSLFPRLRQCHDPELTRILDMVALLEADHRLATPHHNAVNHLVRSWIAAGRLDPAETNALHGHLMALRGIYDAHIAVEDGDVFPAAARLLSPRQIEEIGQEMLDRRANGKADGRPR